MQTDLLEFEPLAVARCPAEYSFWEGQQLEVQIGDPLLQGRVLAVAHVPVGCWRKRSDQLEIKEAHHPMQ